MLLQPPSWSVPVSPAVSSTLWLECIGLTLWRGGRLELDGVTLRCVQGEWLALVDPAGQAGSAVFAAVEGRCRLQQGELRWRQGVRPAMATVLGGMQWPSALTLRELLRSLELPRNLPLIETLGMQRVVDRSLDTLAPVEARLVQLAIADVQPSDTLLLDDPLQGLQPEERQRLTAVLGSVRRRWPQALVRVGGSGALLDLCDRRVHLDRGRVCRESVSCRPHAMSRRQPSASARG